MAFVIDGSEWHFDGLNAENIESAIEKMLECIDRVVKREEKLWLGEDFHTRAMLGNLCLWELFDPTQPIHLKKELEQELAAKINRLDCYIDDANLAWPEHFEKLPDISINGAPPENNQDVLWAHLNALQKKAVGCIGWSRKGKLQTVSDYGTANIHWLDDPSSHTTFWREAIILEGDGPKTLKKFASHAYPDLYFVSSALRDCNSFTGGYYAHSEAIRTYLSVLNDHGKWVFTTPPPAEQRTDKPGNDEESPSDQLIERRFELLHLVMAPEKPNVYRDKTCKEAREVTIGSRTLYCEWHAKLEKHQNRIHIHAPVKESGDKVVIAIMAPHLPLP